MSKAELFVGDAGITLTYTVKKEGKVQDLTNVTEVKLQLAKVNSTSLDHDITGSISDAENGKVQFTTTTSLHASEAEYEGKVKLTYSGGKIVRASIQPVVVRKEIPTS